MSAELNVTAEQQFIMEEFSHLVGKVLTYVESALPEGKQCVALKKLIENAIYDARNSFIEKSGGKE